MSGQISSLLTVVPILSFGHYARVLNFTSENSHASAGARLQPFQCRRSLVILCSGSTSNVPKWSVTKPAGFRFLDFFLMGTTHIMRGELDMSKKVYVEAHQIRQLNVVVTRITDRYRYGYILMTLRRGFSKHQTYSTPN